MLSTSVGWVNGYYQRGYQDVERYQDGWGVVWRTIEYQIPFSKGKYTEPYGHPLQDDQAIEKYTHLDTERPSSYCEARQVLQDYQDEYWILGVTPSTIFGTTWALHGYEQLLVDMANELEKAYQGLDFPYHYHLPVICQSVELGVDMIWLDFDVCGQHAILMYSNIWRTYLKPRMAELIASLRAINPHIKIAYHTDGVVCPIIPELIEIGIDVLNPIKP
jgi:uroporphyrinogen decarboxylase